MPPMSHSMCTLNECDQQSCGKLQKQSSVHDCFRPQKIHPIRMRETWHYGKAENKALRVEDLQGRGKQRQVSQQFQEADQRQAPVRKFATMGSTTGSV